MPTDTKKLQEQEAASGVRHLQLWTVCRDQEAYKAGTDTNDHDLPDCSCGCRHFHQLEGINGMDWGVCVEPRSPRAGLLTFEHMRCPFFTSMTADDEKAERARDFNYPYTTKENG